MPKLRVGDVFTSPLLLNGQIEYVVERTALTGGGTGHGPHDVYPDGWQVKARVLRDGAYDPEGREITFYQTGCFTTMIRPAEVTVVRRMRQTFVPVED